MIKLVDRAAINSVSQKQEKKVISRFNRLGLNHFVEFMTARSKCMYMYPLQSAGKRMWVRKPITPNPLKNNAYHSDHQNFCSYVSLGGRGLVVVVVNYLATLCHFNIKLSLLLRFVVQLNKSLESVEQQQNLLKGHWCNL